MYAYIYISLLRPSLSTNVDRQSDIRSRTYVENIEMEREIEIIYTYIYLYIYMSSILRPSLSTNLERRSDMRSRTCGGI